MRIMRNLCGVAPRLSSVIKNLSTQLPPSHGSCRYSDQHADSLRRIGKKQLRGLSEEVAKAVQAIWSSNVKAVLSKKTLYLVDEKAAKEFSALIMSVRQPNPCYVAEINPGLGFLTKELLEAGIPSINMFEGIPYFTQNLTSIAEKYPGRATLRPVHFQHMWCVSYMDWKENSNILNTYFNDIKKRAWEEEPAIQIIGALGHIHFIRLLSSSIIFQNTLVKYGRMVLHVAIPPSVWAYLTCTNETYDLYRDHVVIFQTLFNYELLGVLPRSAFYPHYRQPKRRRVQRRSRIRRGDEQFMNVVKIEPKADLFKDDFMVSDIVPFYYFVHYHLKRRTSRVIPALEKWVPGCGRTLIAHGFNIYTEFGELTPQEIMNLFKLFRSWPELKLSSFASSMDTFLMRMDKTMILDKNSNNLEEMFQFFLDDAQLPLE